MTPKIKSIEVSFNQPVDYAIEECKEWEEKGYLVTETYGNDYDCGQILEFPEEGNGVLERHKEHMARCKVNSISRRN